MLRFRRHSLVRFKTAILHRPLLTLLLILALAGPLGAETARSRNTYQEFDGIFVFYRPKHLTIYRKLLPSVFDMPKTPLVKAFFADYYKMEPGTLEPYREAAVFLLARFQGEKAWHCITMPVTSDKARRLGIMFLGFPKIMGDISLRRAKTTYTGTLKLDGVPVMSISLATERHLITPAEEKWFQELAGIPSLNILNGRVTNPMPAKRKSRMNLLQMSRMFPEYLEVKVGKAEISLKPPSAGARPHENSDAFRIQPAEIVLAYYLKSKFGFSFKR